MSPPDNDLRSCIIRKYINSLKDGCNTFDIGVRLTEKVNVAFFITFCKINKIPLASWSTILENIQIF